MFVINLTLAWAVMCFNDSMKVLVLALALVMKPNSLALALVMKAKFLALVLDLA